MDALALNAVIVSVLSLFIIVPATRIKWPGIPLEKVEKEIDLAGKNVRAIRLGISTLLVGGFVSILFFILDSPFTLLSLFITFALYFTFHLVSWVETGVEIINPRFLLVIIIGLWGIVLSTLIVTIF